MTAEVSARNAPAGFDRARQCGAKTRQGTPCRQAKGVRTDHPGSGRCVLHGGRTPNGRKHAQREQAVAALTKLGVPIQADPQQALREAVWECVGNVAFLREQVQRMAKDEVGRAGLIGNVLSLTREGDAVPVSEEARAMVKLYNEERDRLVKTAKAAIDAGIAEREIKLLEDQADHVVSVILATFDELELDAEQMQRAREIAARRFLELAPKPATAPAGAELN